MASPDKLTRPILGLTLVAGLIVVPALWLPTEPTPSTIAPEAIPSPDDRVSLSSHLESSAQPPPSESKPSQEQVRAPQTAPPEVQALLDRVFEQVPEAGAGVSGYEFQSWPQQGRPTRAALGIKAIPGLDPDRFIDRVMDVDGYEGRVAHVIVSQSRTSSEADPADTVPFYQRIAVPGISEVQHELMLVDAGTIKGYRVAYWYLLQDETDSLDPKLAARGAFNVGVWLSSPGVVGYALSSWPRRDDLNRLQWLSLTTGADALARRVVEGNIDGMASWSLP